MKQRGTIVAGLLALVACTRTHLNVVEGGRCAIADGGVPVRAAADFLDMLGMRVSVSDLPRTDGAGRSIVDDLRELGVTRVTTADSWPDHRPPAAATLRAAGLRSLFALSFDVDVDAFFADWGDVSPAIGLPGIDVPNSMIDARTAVDNARRIVAAARAQPPERRPPIVGMHVNNEAAAHEVGDLSDLCDFGAFRAGIGQYPPRNSFGGWIELAQSIATTRPLVATSFSYVGRSPSVAPPPAESEVAQAKYVLRMLLSLFNRGVVQAYQNRLQDLSCPECKDGLLREDGSQKPAYAAWRALVQVLSAQQPATPPPSTLAFSLEVPASVTDVERTILGRSDGTIVLLLWREVASTDEPVTTSLTLRFEDPPRAVSAHDLLSGDERVLSSQAGATAVTVSDMPTAIVLVPGCAP